MRTQVATLVLAVFAAPVVLTHSNLVSAPEPGAPLAAGTILNRDGTPAQGQVNP